MSVLNPLIALFIMAAAFSFSRKKLLWSLALPVLVIAPVALCIIDGTDGLVYSLAGAGAALILTMPLSLFGIISGSELIISVALGGALGVVQYVIAFCIATALISLQKLMRVESACAPDALECPPPGYGSGLLALDETSALVEIEALKMLHKDRMNSVEAEFMERWAVEGEEARGFGRARFLPWCAKLALATLAVLMLGSSI